MKNVNLIRFATVCLTLFGAYLSFNLMLKHEDGFSGRRWFDDTCEAKQPQKGGRSCDQVMAGKWGVFPPVATDAPQDSREQPVVILDVLSLRPRPVALLGMIYFAVLGTWYALVGRCSWDRRRWHLIPLIINAAGVVAACFFTYLMFFGETEAWCPWCLVTHLINALVLVGTFTLRPKPGLQKPDTPGHPGSQLAASAIVCCVAVSAACWFYHEGLYQARKATQAIDERRNLQGELGVLLTDPEFLYGMYVNAEEVEWPLRPDDPVKNPDATDLTLVVVSDFHCPSCARFAKRISSIIEPLFHNEIRIVFKHYITAEDCCEYLINRPDGPEPDTCRAALAVEAARVLGGNEAFWKAHDLLFASLFDHGHSHGHDQSDRLDKAFLENLAEQLGLDRSQFLSTLKSATVADRVAEDIRTARKLGVDATPSVYLNGRFVPSASRVKEAFWQEVARRHFKSHTVD